MSPRAPGLWRAVKHGARRRCPSCGEARLYRRGLRVDSPCPCCGVELLENEGDPWAFVIVLDRVFVLLLIAVVYFRLGPPTTWGVGILFAAVTVLFVATTPHRFGVCLALVYWARRGRRERGEENG